MPGHLRAAKTAVLVSVEEAIEAMRKAATGVCHRPAASTTAQDLARGVRAVPSLRV